MRAQAAGCEPMGEESEGETMALMSAEQQASQIEAVAKAYGLEVDPMEPGTDFGGAPTARYQVRQSGGSASLPLELSAAFDASDSRLQDGLRRFLGELAKRLRNPRPDFLHTLSGLPLSFGKFAWPFHGSTSGADTFIVHGEIRLENGTESPLHAKVSASMTQTFAEVVEALEQPFAEGFIYNAIRKTMDQGQLELVKSGNRQPVPVTTRYYSAKQGKFIFNDTTEEQRTEFLAAKLYWQSGVLGGGAPVWLADPRDAQYLNVSVADLKSSLPSLAGEGLVRLAEDEEFATPTDALLSHAERYQAEVDDALRFIKPSFNEAMRAGQTNM